MKKLFLISIILLYIYATGKSQTKDSAELKRGSVYIELGGNALVYSLGADFLFMKKGMLKSSVSIGYTYMPGDFFGDVLSPGVNVFYGKVHNIEAGIGYSFMPNRHSADYAYPFRLGYRYQKDRGGLFFKAGFLLLISDNIVPWGGLVIGYTLK